MVDSVKIIAENVSIVKGFSGENANPARSEKDRAGQKNLFTIHYYLLLSKMLNAFLVKSE